VCVVILIMWKASNINNINININSNINNNNNINNMYNENNDQYVILLILII